MPSTITQLDTSVELDALRLQVQQFQLENQKLSKEKEKLEEEILNLSMFAWNTASWCVALADLNRWLTGTDLAESQRKGTIPPNSEISVTNETAWEHFTYAGPKTEFDKEFHHEATGERNLPKLIKHFPRFLRKQVV